MFLSKMLKIKFLSFYFEFKKLLTVKHLKNVQIKFQQNVKKEKNNKLGTGILLNINTK